MKKIVCLIGAIVLMLGFAACGASKTMTDHQATAVAELTGMTKTEAAENCENITAEVLADGRDEKFPAVKNVFKYEDNLYAVISEPVGYHGPISLTIVIDGNTKKTVGMRIVEDMEATEYVRDYHKDWFVGRFKDKDVSKPLRLTKLEAETDSDIIAITGATVSTRAVIYGVNAAMGAYFEAIEGGESESVKLVAEQTGAEATIS